MNCPHCGNFVPDTNFRCPNCRKAVQEILEPSAFMEQGVKRSTLNSTTFIFLAILIGVIVLGLVLFFKSQGKQTSGDQPSSGVGAYAENNSTPAKNTDSNTPGEPMGRIGELKVGSVVNKENPGQPIQIEEYVQGDQVTIFDFYSEYCPPCEKMSPWLTELDKKRDDIVVFKVDINRSGYTGIDWGSPLAQQYNLKSIPHFIVFKVGGLRDLEGKEAYIYIMNLLQQEGIIQ